jgi:hypothetical protein
METPPTRLDRESLTQAVRQHIHTHTHFPDGDEDLLLADTSIFDDKTARMVKVGSPADITAFAHLYLEAVSLSGTSVLVRTARTPEEWNEALAQNTTTEIRSITRRPYLDHPGTWARAPRLTTSETSAWRPNALDVNEGLLLLQISGTAAS